MMKTKRVLFIVTAIVIAIALLAFAWFKSAANSLKGELTGGSYAAEFYDNYGVRFLIVNGENIEISGNIAEKLGVDSDGKKVTNYSVSSVITITIDGKQMTSCNNTVMFTESGLRPDVEFTISDLGITSEGGLRSLTSISKQVNKYKNYFKKPQVVVIQSQLGVPICAYSGDEVYWEIPKNLPEMTKLMIDGKALYIHRAKFQVFDSSLIQ